eukprot:5027795-Pyramimonas_sp.AAC.1
MPQCSSWRATCNTCARQEPPRQCRGLGWHPSRSNPSSLTSRRSKTTAAAAHRRDTRSKKRKSSRTYIVCEVRQIEAAINASEELM